MSEKITRLSAGVKANEIDLSSVTDAPELQPTGIPAGVIGTAKNGPAFVPVTVPNSSELVRIFGDSKGNEFGPIALREWLRNASAGTYVRVLGAGDGKQKAASGIVTNAGFVVGQKQVQANGDIGNNIYSNSTLQDAARTYFVGCLMSESNGSTFLSSAGKQSQNVKATLVDALQLSDIRDNTVLTITVPVTAGGDGNAYTIVFNDVDDTGVDAQGGNLSSTIGTVRLGVGMQTMFGSGISNSEAATVAAQVVACINDGTNGAQLTRGDTWAVAGIPGITATHTADGKITITADNPGSAGNSVSFSQSGGAGHNVVANGANLAGGEGGAVPIVRGVIFAPQGVNLKLETIDTVTNQQFTEAVLGTFPARGTAATVDGPSGASTGSIRNGHQTVLILNGHGSDLNRSIQFSFDPDSPQYLSSVLNTDPLKIEEKGHYLYADFPVYRSQAIATGSGALAPGGAGSGGLHEHGERIAFLLTGSSARNVGTANNGTSTLSSPNFENFENRFQRAFTPMFISQDMGTRHNLFKISALTDGEGPATSFKIGIQNIKPSTDSQNLYGSFDLIVRKFDDTDQNPVILESFTNLSLDQDSDRYICRIIGDQKISFNFDDTEESQSITIEGEYTNKSSYIRIEPSEQLKAGQIPDTAVPFGFRGHYHLQTSGSALSLPDERGNSIITSGSIGNKMVQPPIPMIQNISVGVGANKKVNSNIYWGPQFTKVQSTVDPNKTFTNTTAINNFTKYFGDFRSDIPNMWVGDNEGTANDSDLGLVDADLFNFNMFALDKVKVVTGSDAKADPKKWVDATYVRQGNIVNDPNSSTKTRALQVSDFEKVANRKYGKFTCFLQGGWNGVNIFDAEKSKLSDVAAHREFLNEATQGGANGPTVASYKKAIDIMATDADVDIKLLAIPGQRNLGVTDHAISAVESRFDAMYVMDIEEKDANDAIVTGSSQNVDVTNTIANFKNRGLNTSFAASYFPDVIIRHPDRSTNLTVPPSVVVLGAFSQNDSIGHPWFAPAGFARASLQTSIQSTMNLNQENLDDLYDSKINPLTSFSGTNLVIWGQKTLQQAANALDRVNVRRLLIEIRRLVRDAANQIIFEPNREETLVRFRSLVNPILENVQENQGLARYKVIIDTTTTTQADVENNTIRGKILLQPNKTIEFVSLDFVVTNAGTEI